MNRVFGKKKTTVAPPAPSLQDASSGVGGRVEAIDAKIASLDKELKAYKDKIKSCRNTSAKKTLQRRAMEVLKRKRMYESQREQLAGQQYNIDQAAFGIESAKASVSTVAALKAANTELKNTIRRDLDIDEIDDLADDMADLMYDFEEMNDILGKSFATPEYIDEADLEAELDMLDDEFDELEDEATPSYLQDSLPATPTANPAGKVPEGSTSGYGLPARV